MTRVAESNEGTLYIFLDEAGNFDFSPTGTRFFTMSAFSRVRPFAGIEELLELKYDLWEQGVEFEYLHAAEDTNYTRTNVFNVLRAHIDSFRLDCISVEKRKTHPALQENLGRFYKKILDILLIYVLRGHIGRFTKVFIITDLIPVERKRKDIEKGIKITVAQWSREHNTAYNVFHYASKSDLNLQIVDYLNWAVYRKWERGDLQSYDAIKACIRSEFEVFKDGKETYY
jgi:hypothetical protein